MSLARGPELEAKLRRAISDARSYWPEVRVSDEAVLAHVALAIERASLPSVEEWLANGTMRDIFLACACASGDATALAIFESRYMANVDGALLRLGIDQPVIDEAKQNVRVAILVGEAGRPPRIADYSGAGNLAGWLRVIVINAARRILRRRDTTAPADEVSFEALTADGEHRELDFLKAAYREKFKLAFRAALAELSARDRTLLRQHYMLGMTIDHLATVYGAHRATCARWLERCRDTLYANTRAALVRSLHVDRTEFENIMRLIQSQLDVSVRRYLEPDDG
jgi:RNA polymerase sigma-70 factor (ECF subfamily)